MDRDQLEALRRQIEEDYRLDIAAIERLQRRYSAFNYVPAAPSGGPSDSVLRGAYTAPTDWPKYEGGADSRTEPRIDSRIEPASPVLPPSPLPERQNDELVGSLRTMFNHGRK